MKAVAVTFIPVLIIACNSTVPVRPLTEVEQARKKLSDLNAKQIQVMKKLSDLNATQIPEVEQARKKLSDLNATQIQETKKLIETRNLLLSMPKDSPPTREISRQLAISNKQATDLLPQVYSAELALEKTIARQLAILNKQATDLDSQVFAAELGLEAAIHAEAEAALQAALDANATASGANPAAQPVATSGVLRLHPFQIFLDDNSGTRSVTGEVENMSTNAVTDVTVVFKLVDDRDESVGTVSDFIARIEGESRWAFKALVLDENATRAKFMELKGDELNGIPALPGSDPDPE